MSTLSPFIAASADDGMVRGLSSASYPPAYSSANDSGTWMRVQNAFGGGLYFYNNVLMRWDTSALTAGATISAAVLHIYPRTANFSDADSRHLVGEWYSWTPSMGSGNYSTTPGSTAFDVTVASLTKDADNAITLTSPDANISKTGYTGLRLYISGADPPGNNVVEFSDYDNTTNIPQLVITYTAITVANIVGAAPAITTTVAATLSAPARIVGAAPAIATLMAALLTTPAYLTAAISIATTMGADLGPAYTGALPSGSAQLAAVGPGGTAAVAIVGPSGTATITSRGPG